MAPLPKTKHRQPSPSLCTPTYLPHRAPCNFNLRALTRRIAQPACIAITGCELINYKVVGGVHGANNEHA